MNRRFLLGLTLVCITLTTASLAMADDAPKKKKKAKGPAYAVCVIMPVDNNGVGGTLHFVQQGKKVRITGEVKGLTPGDHGFHVHEFGDVSDLETGKSAGGHFNPSDAMHGKPSDSDRHVGDLGNITANADGVAKINITDNVISLRGPQSIIGRSLMIHADPDDFGQPTGNAGARVGFGVIGIAAAPSGS